MTDPPSDMTFSSVVSRESVRIAFLIAALKNLEIQSADIGNAYLNTSTNEKVYTTADPEFGADEAKTIIIVRALYRLKSSGAAWRSHFAHMLRDLHFTSTYTDPDVWFRPATKHSGDPYYKCILVYVDDILCISENPGQIINLLQSDPFNYRLKDIGPPTRYLGAKVACYTLPDSGVNTWYISAESYLQKAIPVIE
jgi:hypothetical protein